MPQAFFKRMTQLGFGFTTIVAAGLACFNLGTAALGAVVAAAWMFLNFFFLFRLVETAVGPMPKRKDRVFLLTVLKFPVLYLAGFFILSARLFPLEGIFAGLTAFIAGFTAAWFLTNSAKAEGRTA